MGSSEGSGGGADRLDELLQAFAANDYAPSGADSPGDVGGHGHAEHGGPSVRRLEHRGHVVEVATHYEITIDGRRWDHALEVRHDGSVMYHGLPQYVVPSALDIVRAVIDHSLEAPEAVRSAIDPEGGVT